MALNSIRPILGRLSSSVTMIVVAFLAVAPGVGVADIIWSGNYEAGNFKQWHTSTDADTVTFFQVPEYGRPVQYGGQPQRHVGNGELLSLVAATERTVNGVYYAQGPTRGNSAYAAKFTVKNSMNGSEPDDCDNGVCRRRRTELTAQSTLPRFYNAMPYLSERWVSISVFVPRDWDNSGSGWGPMVYQIKPHIDGGGVGPAISLMLQGGRWTVEHNWTDAENCSCSLPWQQQMDYTSVGTHEALIPDFPDRTASERALTLTKGVWTDWVMHIKFDARGSRDGGQGFLNVWNRKDDGDWVHVLRVVPKVITIGGLTFDRGIAHKAPATGSDPGGFGVKAGMYMGKDQVWNLKNNRVLYNANIKVGSARATFSEMSPDGSSPGSPDAASPPKPPLVAN